jgi:hypothetical protein
MFRRLAPLLLVAAAACAHDDAAAPPATTTSSTSTSTSTTTSTIAVRTTAAATCPVSPSQLRTLSIDYWGFDNQQHTGTLVVNARVADAMTRVFASLLQQRFPIRRMDPIDVFGGDDEKSLEADNTAAYNCRRVVGPGPPRWSTHAYGLAIDVNPVENPYLESGHVHPAAGREYLTRSPYRPGMAVDGGVLVKAFESIGWKWGGRWASTPDYQHFSSTGG